MLPYIFFLIIPAARLFLNISSIQDGGGDLFSALLIEEAVALQMKRSVWQRLFSQIPMRIERASSYFSRSHPTH